MHSIKIKKKVAVVGANGFLGRSIVNLLSYKDYDIYGVFHNKTQDIPECCEKISINEFIIKQIDVEIIFLAIGNYANSHHELIELNCVILKQLTDRYPNARFIYVSSVNVYGLHKEKISEQSSFNSPGLYGRAKLVGEFIVSRLSSYAIIRMGYLYGKGLNNNSFLPTIVEQAKTNKKIILYGKGTRKQDYLHIDDASALCITLAESQRNGIFIGASGDSISNLEAANFICQYIPNCTIEFQGDEIGGSSFFDISATIEKCGWKPQISFSTGIKNMII